LHKNALLGVYIHMTALQSWRAGFASAVCGLVFLYIAYGLSHPPEARASRYQGVNMIRNISIVLSNSGSQQDVFPSTMPTKK